MTILDFVGYFYLIISLLIPIRQYKNGLFWLFFVAGITELLTEFFYSVVHANMNIVLYVFNILILATTYYYTKHKKFTTINIGTIIVLTLFAFVFSFNLWFNARTPFGHQIILASIFVINILIIYNLLILMFRNIFETGAILLYFPILCLGYMFTALRIGLLALRLEGAAPFHVIGLFIEGLSLIFFLFYNIKNSPKFSLAGSKAITEEAEE